MCPSVGVRMDVCGHRQKEKSLVIQLLALACSDRHDKDWWCDSE
jgi:hypothetical protein